MGHRNIETAMAVYNETSREKKIECFANLEGKILKRFQPCGCFSQGCF